MSRRSFGDTLTMASTVNGRSRRPAQNAVRNASTRSTSADERRSASVTVKKNVPPGTKLRRNLTIERFCPGYRCAHPGYVLLGVASGGNGEGQAFTPLGHPPDRAAASPVA